MSTIAITRTVRKEVELVGDQKYVEEVTTRVEITGPIYGPSPVAAAWPMPGRSWKDVNRYLAAEQRAIHAGLIPVGSTLYRPVPE
jgi:hypothetical protein